MMKKIKDKTYDIGRGSVFCLKKQKLCFVIVSNKLHNLLSKYLIAVLITDKNVDQVRESLEFSFELKGKKWKISVGCFYTINKQILQESAEGFLGKLDDQAIDKLDRKIRLILDL